MLGKPEGNLQDMSWLDGSPQKTGSFLSWLVDFARGRHPGGVGRLEVPS